MPKVNMADPSSTTIVLQDLLTRFAAGDVAARDALIDQAMQRLMAIARKLLRNFGGEQRVEMWTSDVFGEAYPRLAKALDDVRPASPAEFFGLARLQFHRALLDRVRSLEGRDVKRGPRPQSLSGPGNDDGPQIDVPDPDDERHRQLMLDLVEAVGKLPDNEGQTVWLKLAGHTHKEIGELLGVHKDTIDRYWNKACVKLVKPLSPFMDAI